MKGNYVVSLETNLASNSFKYSSEDHVVSGNEDSYIIMKFSAKVGMSLILLIDHPHPIENYTFVEFGCPVYVF